MCAGQNRPEGSFPELWQYSLVCSVCTTDDGEDAWKIHFLVAKFGKNALFKMVGEWKLVLERLYKLLKKRKKDMLFTRVFSLDQIYTCDRNLYLL